MVGFHMAKHTDLKMFAISSDTDPLWTDINVIFAETN
jgi:hypothetical protein